MQNSEPIATFALTNSLAAFLTPWLVLLGGMAFGKVPRRKRRPGILVCLIPLAACLLLTKSRSGYVAAGVGLLLAWLTCREQTVRIRWKWPLAMVAIVAILAAATAATRGLDRELLARASRSFGYRVQYWQSSWQMIADHPLIGCGPGNFQNAYTRYKLPEASEEVADPHNFLIELWATAGTPAALALIGVLACFFGTVWRRKRQRSLEREEEKHDRGQTTDGWRHILAGGAGGFLLSVPVGWLGAAPPGAAAVLLGLPLAAGTVWLLLGWIREGRLPGVLPAVACAALLVDLLATGGIGLPSVAGTLWLLVALGLQGERPRNLHPAAAWTALAGAMALAVACYGTAYSPVLACQAQLRMAESDPARAVEHLEAAAAADPLANEPWRQLAAIQFENWWQAPDEQVFARFEEADAKTLKLAPNSAPAWLASGDWHFRAASKADSPTGKPADEIRQKALAAYRRAVMLYPNGAVYRGKLAEAYRASGDMPAFRREAELALQLDGLTPHADKKLPADLRERLARSWHAVTRSCKVGDWSIFRPNGVAMASGCCPKTWTCPLASGLVFFCGVGKGNPIEWTGRQQTVLPARDLQPSSDRLLSSRSASMRTLFIAVLSIVAGVALGFGIAVVRVRMTPWDARFDEGSETAASPSPHAAKPTPKAVIDRTEYDFDTIDRDVGGSHSFVITNAGDAPLSLNLGKRRSPCVTVRVDRESIPPGESGKVTVTWQPAEEPTVNRQTAIVYTSDPALPQIVLTVVGRVKVLLRSSSTALDLGRITQGETAAGQVRLWSYLDEPLKIVGHQWSDPVTAGFYEAAVEPLSAADVSSDPLARSGVLVKVTAKPGMPEGPLQQKIVLQTNVAAVPTMTLPITGTVNSEIAVVSQRWDAENNILLLGQIPGRTGKQFRVLLLVRGPHRKEVTFKVGSVTPDVLKVTFGQPREGKNGLVVETPLMIDVPPGSPSMTHLQTEATKMGEITIETTHPFVPTLRMHVSFAIEE